MISRILSGTSVSFGAARLQLLANLLVLLYRKRLAPCLARLLGVVQRGVNVANMIIESGVGLVGQLRRLEGVRQRLLGMFLFEKHPRHAIEVGRVLRFCLEGLVDRSEERRVG